MILVSELRESSKYPAIFEYCISRFDADADIKYWLDSHKYLSDILSRVKCHIHHQHI